MAAPDIWAYAREGKLQLIRACAQQPGFDVNAVDDDQRTMLHWGVTQGHKDVVVALLEMKASQPAKCLAEELTRSCGRPP